jgi:hypothetical protein
MTFREVASMDTLEIHSRGDRAWGDALTTALRFSGRVERWTHGFHAYPAGLHPDAAAVLLDMAHPESTLFDPFCGGGTVLVEGRVRGLTTFGSDLSPTALRVAGARTMTASDDVLARARAAARQRAEDARRQRGFGSARLEVVRSWYEPHVLGELESIYEGVREEPGAAGRILRAAFSSIVVKASLRESETRARRSEARRPVGTTAVLFHKKVRELARQIASLRAVVPEGTPKTRLSLEDARLIACPVLVDAVITSPPYPATYDYLPLQHLRSVWFADRPRKEDEIGPRRSWKEAPGDALKTWVAQTSAWVSNVSTQIRPGGHLVVVVGDGFAADKRIDALVVHREAAAQLGLEEVAFASALRSDSAFETRREHALVWRTRR